MHPLWAKYFARHVRLIIPDTQYRMVVGNTGSILQLSEDREGDKAEIPAMAE